MIASQDLTGAKARNVIRSENHKEGKNEIARPCPHFIVFGILKIEQS